MARTYVNLPHKPQWIVLEQFLQAVSFEFGSKSRLRSVLVDDSPCSVLSGALIADSFRFKTIPRARYPASSDQSGPVIIPSSLSPGSLGRSVMRGSSRCSVLSVSCGSTRRERIHGSLGGAAGRHVDRIRGVHTSCGCGSRTLTRLLNTERSKENRPPAPRFGEMGKWARRFMAISQPIITRTPARGGFECLK